MRNRCLFWLLAILAACLGQTVSAVEVPEITIIKEPPSISGATSFAIFVDSTTFVNAGNILLKYRSSIENDGLPTYIIVANWKHPEQIKKVISDLYHHKRCQLEGAVFVGDIPIVMLQDAHHLTSAFRMDVTNRTLFESSVPTDRFYDDLDLKCEFIKHDSSHTLIHYYRLLPESPVKLQRELYTSRIPILNFSKKRYKILRQFLKKVIRVKSAPAEPLDNIITLTGFNYISDSQAAIIDEVITMRETFRLNHQLSSRIQQIFHRAVANPKQQLLHSLALPNRDLLILHSHGNEETQFIQENEPNTFIADENVSSPSREITSSPDEMTISMEEINKQKIDTELVILDVCYNGAFHRLRYMAAAYLFSRGDVVSVMANSVNVRQDIALIENIGALSHGARIGHWHQVENYLESHLFGDPTFRFANSSNEKYKYTPPFERCENAPINFKQIFKQSSSPYLRASALSGLHRSEKDDLEKYLAKALQDPANIVRLKAWLILAGDRSEEFIKLLPTGLKDNYELIRRYCALWMGEVGSNSFVQHLARTAVSDPSERVIFNALISLKLIGTKEARTALKWILSEINSYDGGRFIQQVRANLFTITQWLPNEVVPPLTMGTPEEKIKHIRLFRANRHLIALPVLLFLYENDKHVEVRTAAAETLGWYAFYEKRNIILDSFKKALELPEQNANVRKATLLAQKRLIEGPNKANTP